MKSVGGSVTGARVGALGSRREGSWSVGFGVGASTHITLAPEPIPTIP